MAIHLVRLAADDATANPDGVDEVSVRSAVRLVGWFANETRRVFAVLRETPEQKEQRQLAEWVQAQGGVVTLRESTDWYSPGQARMFEIDGVRVVVRFVERKGRRGRIAVEALARAAFRGQETEGGFG